MKAKGGNAVAHIAYIFMSTMCTYIAGMTDNFAKDEYRKLYAVAD